MAQTRRSPARKRRSSRRKRRVNIPAFAALFGILAVIIITAVVLIVRNPKPAAESSSATDGTPVGTTDTTAPLGTTAPTDSSVSGGTTAMTTTQPFASGTGSTASGTGQTTSTTAPQKTALAATTTSCKPPTPTVGEPTYIQGILVVNKTYSLPSTYAKGFDPETQTAFNEMQKAAAAEGRNIYISSGYRSYDYQKRIYNNNVAAYGKEKTDTFSARPGHSEHQTGLALDLNSIDDSFANTPESDWVKEHAHEYGFIIRYPKGKESVTGYKYEPWHLRYLGKEKAKAVHDSGLTLEEYLGIDSSYKN